MTREQISTPVGQDKLFVAVATELSTRYPELDLRFSREQGSSTFGVTAAEHSDEQFEFTLEMKTADQLIGEVTLEIKQLLRLFDD